MTTHSRATVGLATAGLLLAVGGVLHPRVDTGVTFEAGLAGMFESGAWVAAHALTMAGFAVLAASVVSARSGSGRIVAAFAVVGGIAYALAGPAIALTQNSGLSPLFAGSAGIAIWCVVSGARMARAETRGTLEMAAAR